MIRDYCACHWIDASQAIDIGEWTQALADLDGVTVQQGSANCLGLCVDCGQAAGATSWLIPLSQQPDATRSSVFRPCILV